MECFICKKQLTTGTGEYRSFDGHYSYDDKIYCVDCWKLVSPAISVESESIDH
jgi:Pyruvate/2-oxoacid:ferredoxin oxidoreductase delta subunit